jgi:hypothetical protein
MNFSETIANLSKASAFDLFRLHAAIDRVLDQPGWMVPSCQVEEKYCFADWVKAARFSYSGGSPHSWLHVFCDPLIGAEPKAKSQMPVNGGEICAPTNAGDPLLPSSFKSQG